MAQFLFTGTLISGAYTVHLLCTYNILLFTITAFTLKAIVSHTSMPTRNLNKNKSPY